MNLSAGFNHHSPEAAEKSCLNSELWHACAGPLVSLPAIGSHVVYFPQGHSEQVAASTNKEIDGQIPNYPSLPPQLICQLHNATMHADIETDEVYAQMTLQPLSPQEQKEISFLPTDLGFPNKQPTNYFCKTLTASDTSTHGGFSVPRRAAEKVFPPLDFSLQPPAQELIARDLHNNEWKFRHIFRGQPKRHLLTTGWSVFISAKRLVAGDSVLFIWNEKNQLLLGIRRAVRPQTIMPSSVLSCDSMHIGLLAAAAHAASTNSRFTIFYNPRASPCEFVIPLAKYVKAVYHTRVSVGMRFRMFFETEESSVRRYMGTITGICDMDPVRWPNSHWRSVKVGWDESTAGERQPRVSLWEIEPFTTFPMYPSPFPLRLKRPWPQGLPSYTGMNSDEMGLNSMNFQRMQSMNFQGMGISPWTMQQPRLDNNSMFGMQNDIYQAMASAALHEMRNSHPSKQILPSTVQFQQQPQPINGFAQPQILQQPQSQSELHSNFLQQKFYHQNSFNNPPHLTSGAPVSPMHQNFLETSGKPVVESNNNPPLHDLLDSSNSLSSSGWQTKRVALDHLLSGGGASQGITPQINHLGQQNSNVAQNPVSLPPFPGNDPQNNFLFGVNIDSSSLVMHNGIPNLKVVNSENDHNANMAFGSSSFMSSSGNDHSVKQMTTSNSFIDESGFMQSSENMGHANSSNENFVKVYKSGSFGRSLDITKFSSYDELRSELAQMFGLEGQLEDPVRSGWQLVFVDRENDVLLLGDDPWPEFVSTVWYIKILSPEEVHEMGKQGLKFPNQRPNSGCDGFVSRHDERNLGNIIPSVVGTLDF